MKKWILGVVTVLVLGGAGVMYYAYAPVKTYYPNGVLKSQVDKKFFKKHGFYTEYDELSRLKLEVPYKNGLKSGLQKEYFADKGRMEIPYVNDVKDGAAYLYAGDKQLGKWSYKNNQLAGEFVFFDDIKGKFSADNKFEIQAAANEIAKVEGKVVCEESALGKIVTQADEFSRKLELQKCVSVEKVHIAEEDVDVTFEGAYQFPRFTKKSVFKVVDKTNQVGQAYELVKDMSAGVDIPEYMDVSQARLVFEDDNRHVSIEGVAKTGEKIAVLGFDFHDIAALTEASVQASKTYEMNPELFSLLKKLSLSEWAYYTLDGKPVLQFKGGFAPMLMQFEPDTTLQTFNADGKSILAIKGLDGGVNVMAAYPKTGEVLMSFDILTDLKQLRELQAKLQAAESLEDYFGVFEYVKSPAFAKASTTGTAKNIVMNDPSGKTVMRATELQLDWTNEVLVKGDVLLHSPDKGDVKLTYTGEKKTVIVQYADGKTEERPETDTSFIIEDLGLDKVFENIGETYAKQAEEMVDNQKAVNPFLAGFVSGYTKAMTRFNANKTIDQVAVIVANIRVLFSSQPAYTLLNNRLAKQAGLVPSEMYISDEDDEIVNAYGGPVTIVPSQARTDGDRNEAFIIEYTGLSDEACIDLVTHNWGGYNSGLISVAAGKANGLLKSGRLTEVGERLVYQTVDTRYSSDIAAIGMLVSSGFVSQAQAEDACIGGDKGNSVAWKYF